MREAAYQDGEALGEEDRMNGTRSHVGMNYDNGAETIEPYVNDFIKYAKEHKDLTFLVTRIGCGIAGFEPENIAPLFRDAIPVENIYLPADLWEWLE